MEGDLLILGITGGNCTEPNPVRKKAITATKNSILPYNETGKSDGISFNNRAK